MADMNEQAMGPPAPEGSGSTGHGDRYLARALGEAAAGAAQTSTFLGERYRRLARRRGKKKATERWPFHPSSGTYCATTPEPKRRNHIRELEALGDKVTLEPPA